MIRRFKLSARVAGRQGATVMIEPVGREGTWLFKVRPKGSRKVYEISLAAVAEIICWKLAKQEMAERMKQRRRGRR